MISVSAVGSLREHLRPGMFVIVDQFIDRTFARQKSFFGTGIVAHVSMAHPVCHRLGLHLETAAREAGIECVRGGTYLVMEGPQFSSLAESEMYRTWNCDVIGMTNMPEAKLAREAELCYATRRHGDRFRLLASGSRQRHRGGHHQGLAGQCDPGPHLNRESGTAHPVGYRGPGVLLSQCARTRPHYRAACAGPADNPTSSTRLPVACWAIACPSSD